MVADALLKQDEERRRRRDEGEEDEAMEAEEHRPAGEKSGTTRNGDDKSKVVAKTRVSGRW